ncbi:MAG: glycosyl hydrolase family 88 [Spirochaetales bacterium]|nr:glycosyl hydrolase family 88 [Spirochaetales bacterium]
MNRHDVTHNLATAFMNRYDELPQRWHYVNTLGLECFYRVARTLDDKAWLAWVKERYDRFFNSEGIIEEYVLNEFSVDLISAGKLLFDLYGSYGEERYLDQIRAIAHQFTLQMRTPSGGFWHKAIYPQQMWLDGLYMHGPFYIRYGVLTNTVASVLDDLVFQFELMYEKANDSATGLLYHAWDEYRQMRWADPDTGLSANFWSRAMGWYCMALVDVLSFIPPDPQWQGYSKRLISLARKLVQPLLNVQDEETGLWYQVLDQGKRGNIYLESSGSAMFVYFLFKMVRKGYLTGTYADRVGQAARKGFDGLVAHKLVTDDQGEVHLIDICRGAGLGKYYTECQYRDGSFEYYTEREPIVTDNFQGMGPLMLAALEVEYSDTVEQTMNTPFW